MAKLQDQFELARYLPYRLAVAAEKLSTGFARSYQPQYGISIAEWRVLVHINDAGAVSIREIHQRVHLEKSKASRAASQLEAAGYISKEINAEDRRLVVLKLTEKGVKLMEELLRIALAYQAQLDTLLAAQKQALDDALDIILENDL